MNAGNIQTKHKINVHIVLLKMWHPKWLDKMYAWRDLNHWKWILSRKHYQQTVRRSGNQNTEIIVLNRRKQMETGMPQNIIIYPDNKPGLLCWVSYTLTTSPLYLGSWLSWRNSDLNKRVLIKQINTSWKIDIKT